MTVHTSYGNLPTAPFRPAVPGAGSVKAPADTYGPARPETLTGIYKRPVFDTQGRKEAVQLAGVGVMMTAILAGAAVGGKFGPAMMIGGMFAGLALMALGS